MCEWTLCCSTTFHQTWGSIGFCWTILCFRHLVNQFSIADGSRMFMLHDFTLLLSFVSKHSFSEDYTIVIKRGKLALLIKIYLVWINLNAFSASCDTKNNAGTNKHLWKFSLRKVSFKLGTKLKFIQIDVNCFLLQSNKFGPNSLKDFLPLWMQKSGPTVLKNKKIT